MREIVLTFNNPFDERMKSELVFDTARLSTGVTVGVQFSDVRPAQRLWRCVRGTQPCWRAKRWKHPFRRRHHPEFGRHTFIARPGKAVTVSGVRLKPYESVRVRLLVDTDPHHAHLESARIPVLQCFGGRVVGGSTIELRFHHKDPRRETGTVAQPSIFAADFAKAEADDAHGRRPAWMEYMLADRGGRP